jgi:hypothetical protein
MNRGFIKLHRKIQDSLIYGDSKAVHLWIHLLLKANHEERSFLFNGQKVTCKSGEFITGRKVLSDQTKINESKIIRLLSLFENEQLIEQQKTNKYTLISIKNWDIYQNNNSGGQQNEQQMNNKRTTDEHKQELINTLIEELIKNNTAFGDNFKSVWNDWVKFRKEKKSSLTESTIKRQLNLLAKFSEDQAIKMIEQSITNGWTGLFEIKLNKQQGKKPGTISTAEYLKMHEELFGTETKGIE